MALATYADLQTAVASWLNRSDLTSVIPDFITIAEAKLNRELRVRSMVTSTTLTTVSGTQYVTLPTDLLEIENIDISSTSPPRNLHVVTPEYLDEKYPNAMWTGTPDVYMIIGDKIYFGPTPDAAYTVTLKYYQRLAIASSVPSVFTYHPTVYLYGALAEASVYLLDDQRAAYWEAKLKADLDTLNRVDDETVRSGSAMRVRKI